MILSTSTLLLALTLYLCMRWDRGPEDSTTLPDSPTPTAGIDIDCNPEFRPGQYAGGQPYYMLIDTETLEALPEVCSDYRLHDLTLLVLSWRIYTKGGQCLGEHSHILRHSGREVTPRATAIHGIDTEQMHALGLEPRDVLEQWLDDAKGCHTIVAHHLEFHHHVLGKALGEAGLSDTALHDMRPLCTMLWGQTLGIARTDLGRNLYPSLADLFRHVRGFAPSTPIRYSSKGLRDVRLLGSCLETYLQRRATPPADT